jgi:hypothetical protein
MRRASIWVAAAAAIAAVGAVAMVVATFWDDLGASKISPVGWVALALGIVATLALGIGLMRLMFISSRQGYDDRGIHKDC